MKTKPKRMEGAAMRWITAQNDSIARAAHSAYKLHVLWDPMFNLSEARFAIQYIDNSCTFDHSSRDVFETLMPFFQ